MNKKERKKALFSIFFVAALDNFGFGIVFILFAPLILNPMYDMVGPHLSEAAKNVILGVLFACFPLTQIFGAPLIGDIADRMGRKKGFYFTIIGSTCGYIFSAIAIMLHNTAFLMVSRLLTGFFSGNVSLCFAAIADISKDEKVRAKHYSLIAVVWGLSWPLSMLVGGYLSDPSVSPYFTPDIPFWLTAVLSLFSLLFVALYFEDKMTVHKNVKIHLLHGLSNIASAFKLKKLRICFLAILFWTIGWGLAIQWYSAYSIERFSVTQTIITWGLVLQGLFWVMGGLIINPYLLKVISIRMCSIVGLVFAGILVFFSSLFTLFFLFSLLFWLGAVGSSFGFSNTLSLTSLSASHKIQGRVMGLSQSMMSFGWFIVPILGIFLEDLDIRIFYAIAGFSLFLSAFAIFIKQYQKG